jgi:hypothetical protein
MKKATDLILAMMVVIMMVSCGNKTKGVEAEADSTQVDSLMVADSVASGPKDLWNTEAVEAQIRACFAEVNQMAADGAIDITLLDLKFCSEDYLELKEKLYKKVRESKGQLMFDGDEGYHWVPNIGTPMTIDSVKSELLTGNQAQAEVWLKDKRGKNGYLEMTLYLENGAWKVHNWIDDDVYPFGALFNWMQNLYDGTMADAEEHEETDLNNYAE